MTLIRHTVSLQWMCNACGEKTLLWDIDFILTPNHTIPEVMDNWTTIKTNGVIKHYCPKCMDKYKEITDAFQK